MAVKNWTPDQQAAIDARDCGLLVAAAAGSGKTAVLVERILQRISDPENGIDIDRLMIVTFTEAAASEMRERIGAGISSRINELSLQDDVKIRKQLKRQLTLLNKATISTMHAFCSKFIRKNFNKIDLDPNFRVLDGAEATLLREEVADQVLDAQYEAETEGFELLLELYGGKSGDAGLKKLLLHIFEKTGSNPFPKQWRDEKTEAFSPAKLEHCQGDFKNTMWGTLLAEQAKREVGDWIEDCKHAIPLCQEDGKEAYLSAFQYHLGFFQSIANAMEGSWDEIKRAIGLYSPDEFPSKPAEEEVPLLQKLKDMASAVEEYQKEYFSLDSAEHINQLTESYTIVKYLCALVDTFAQAYAEKKREKGVVDYNDLEHFALKILTENPEIAKEQQDFYEEVYTDEYQDTNMTQETILSLVTKQPPHRSNLFMVGDIKQSIYGFRQARPDIFLKKYYDFSKDEEAEQRLITLSKNFRSRKDVIGCVNYVFAKLMTKEVCGMDYTKDAHLYYGANYGDPAYDVSCQLLVADPKEKTEGEDLEQGNLELEATIIAKRIHELIAEANGALSFKDIVILLRATANRAEVYSEVLSQMGIPVFCDVNEGFYQSKEGKTVLAMLQIVDNPLQDIPLLAILKSSIGGFTEDEIAQMRLQNRNGYLYYNLKAWAQAGNSKAIAFLAKLSEFRTYAAEHDLSELILELYRVTDYYNFAGTLPDGRQRQANLQKLYEEAVKYENQTGEGIFGFLAYVERVRGTDGDSGGATVLGENDNVVRIMSIHKSKGLEFPVVFLANMGKLLNRMDARETVLLHQDLGFGMDGFDCTYRVKYDTVSKTVLKWKKNQEMVAEEIRLLYVAMTRAKEKLILTGLIPNVEKTLQQYWNVLSDKEDCLPVRYALKAKTYFDLLLPILLRHPDLQPAQSMAGIPNGPFAWRIPQKENEEECRLQFRLESKENLRSEDVLEATNENLDGETASCEAELMEGIEKRLSTVYAYQDSAEVPAKISVSRLNQNEGLPQILQQPHFMEGKRKRTAAEWGTITHYILQYIPLDAVNKDTVHMLCKKQGLTDEEIARFSWKRIVDFFESGIGLRMRQAKKVYREKPFTMEVPAGQLFSHLSSGCGDTVLVQGVIDCYFEEEDGIVILDYKTDYVLPGQERSAAEKYRTQLELYKRAVEAELGERVKETMICFLQTGECVIQ